MRYVKDSICFKPASVTAVPLRSRMTSCFIWPMQRRPASVIPVCDILSHPTPWRRLRWLAPSSPTAVPDASSIHSDWSLSNSPHPWSVTRVPLSHNIWSDCKSPMTFSDRSPIDVPDKSRSLRRGALRRFMSCRRSSLRFAPCNSRQAKSGHSPSNRSSPASEQPFGKLTVVTNSR